MLNLSASLKVISVMHLAGGAASPDSSSRYIGTQNDISEGLRMTFFSGLLIRHTGGESIEAIGTDCGH